MKSVLEQYRKYVSQDSEHIAVRDSSSELSYAAFDVKVNQLANYLISCGIGNDSIVGVCLTDRVDLAVSIVAILKAGAAYVPIDPRIPAARLTVMLDQLKHIPLVICEKYTADAIQSNCVERTFNLDDEADLLEQCSSEDPNVIVKDDDIAYVVFTSGSTGLPKAVAVKHSGWFNLHLWLRNHFGLTRRSSGAMVTAFGFDITQRAIMAPLFNGSTLNLIDGLIFDPSRAVEFIKKHSVQTLHLAPSVLYMLIDAAKNNNSLSSLRHLFIGGEALNVGRVSEWALTDGSRCRLHHQYGVAECTDVATSYEMHRYEEYSKIGLPVGTAVDNTEILIMDEAFNVQPKGGVGEICIRGESVSAGYYGNEEATNLSFIDYINFNSNLQWNRVYRTGDFGYINDEGLLMCGGRKDTQIKVRGMRVDISEIESSMCILKDVKHAAVLAYEEQSGDKILGAFVVTNRELEQSDEFSKRIRKELRAIVPAHMIPSSIAVLDVLPKTTNGKTDRTKLQEFMDHSKGDLEFFDTLTVETEI